MLKFLYNTTKNCDITKKKLRYSRKILRFKRKKCYTPLRQIGWIFKIRIQPLKTVIVFFFSNDDTNNFFVSTFIFYGIIPVSYSEPRSEKHSTYNKYLR